MATLAQPTQSTLRPLVTPSPPRWILPLLRVPLAAKLAGANGLIVLAAVVAAIAVRGAGGHEPGVLAIVGLAIAASVAANVALVALALRPLRALETAADRVCRGDLTARVAPSPLADREMARVGEALNLALDGLAADRG